MTWSSNGTTHGQFIVAKPPQLLPLKTRFASLFILAGFF
jgi:hypothetical protein